MRTPECFPHIRWFSDGVYLATSPTLLDKQHDLGILNQRPDFGPTQVTKLEELIVGKKYVEIIQGGFSIPFFIDEPPYLDSRGNSWGITVSYEVVHGRIYIEDDVSLIRLNIFPNKNGIWSRSTWLADPEKCG